METKSLLIGIVSFIAGALLVSTAATTFDKPKPGTNSTSSSVTVLQDKSGEEFDAEFISQMIVHHEGAVEMAKLAEAQAKHSEIKELADEVIAAQQREITQMKQWQSMWGYRETPEHNSH